MPVRQLTLNEYESEAKNADIALWRPRSFSLLNPCTWPGQYISRYTGGPFSHVTGIVYWSEIDCWMSSGYAEGRGGFAEPLDAAVLRAESGRIDIYRIKQAVYDNSPGATPECVSANLGHDLISKYNWGAIFLIAAPMLPVVGMFWPRKYLGTFADNVSAGLGGICSQHIARSASKCGIELVDKPHYLTTPNDLAESWATQYVCTIVK